MDSLQIKKKGKKAHQRNVRGAWMVISESNDKTKNNLIVVHSDHLLMNSNVSRKYFKDQKNTKFIMELARSSKF